MTVAGRGCPVGLGWISGPGGGGLGTRARGSRQVPGAGREERKHD